MSKNQDAEDLAGLIPVKITMSPEEWEWFTSKLEDDEEGEENGKS